MRSETEASVWTYVGDAHRRRHPINIQSTFNGPGEGAFPSSLFGTSACGRDGGSGGRSTVGVHTRDSAQCPGGRSPRNECSPHDPRGARVLTAALPCPAPVSVSDSVVNLMRRRRAPVCATPIGCGRDLDCAFCHQECDLPMGADMMHDRVPEIPRYRHPWLWAEVWLRSFLRCVILARSLRRVITGAIDCQPIISRPRAAAQGIEPWRC